LKINADAKEFLDLLNSQNLPQTDEQWLNTCFNWSCEPKVLSKHRNKTKYASHYAFIEKLSEVMPSDHHIVTSDGSANVVTMQVMDLKGNQRLITNTGCAPMGYGLPAALGAATNHKIVCIEGDGSLQMNIQELQTLTHHQLPIKMFVINNDGYLSIKITQEAFFGGKQVASGKESGISFPNLKKLCKAYNLQYMSITKNSDYDKKLPKVFEMKGPVVCELFTHPYEKHEPKVVHKGIDSEGRIIPGELTDMFISDVFNL